MATRRELVAAIRERYEGATREEKGRILDELAAVAGYHRKHAIRVLARSEPREARWSPGRGRRYGEADREALVVLWEASDRVCSKRLKPLLPVLLPALVDSPRRPGRGVSAARPTGAPIDAASRRQRGPRCSTRSVRRCTPGLKRSPA